MWLKVGEYYGYWQSLYLFVASSFNRLFEEYINLFFRLYVTDTTWKRGLYAIHQTLFGVDCTNDQISAYALDAQFHFPDIWDMTFWTEWTRNNYCWEMYWMIKLNSENMIWQAPCQIGVICIANWYSV